jgi:hypothetical protein
MPTTTPRSVAVLVMVALLLSPGAILAQDRISRDADVWFNRVTEIPIGATVKLRTTTGERLTAVLLARDESGIVVKPATRIPERSRRLSYDRIDKLDRYEDRVSFGKCIGVGVAIAGAVFLGLLASAR